MSHFVTVKSSMTNIEMARKACKRMGFSIVGENAKVEQYGTNVKADLVLDKGDNGQGAVGLAKQADGTIAIVGDCYHATNNKLRAFYGKDKELSRKLEVAYAIEDAVAKVTELGFLLSENSEGTVGEDGMITMVAVNMY